MSAAASALSNHSVGGPQALPVIAAQLRAQIPCSTDPKRLERLAREAEGRPWPERSRARQGKCFLLDRLIGRR
jgi:hypothetical protein